MSTPTAAELLATIDATPAGGPIDPLTAFIERLTAANVVRVEDFVLDAQSEDWLAVWTGSLAHTDSGARAWASAALRARMLTERGEVRPLHELVRWGAPAPARADAWEQWAHTQRADAVLDRALAGVRCEGEVLRHTCDLVGAACWSRGRTDLIRPVGEYLLGAARAVHPQGTGRTCPQAWGISHEEPRALALPHPVAALTALRLPRDEENALALTLWRAGEAHRTRAHTPGYVERELDAGMTTLAPTMHGLRAQPLVHVQRPALITTSPPGPLVFLTFGARAAERLQLARGELSVARAEVARRGRAHWERAGRSDLAHGVVRLTCTTAEEFTRQACRWLHDPWSAGADKEDLAGRELLVPVDAALLEELIRVHLGREYCDGLRLVRASGTRGLHSGPRCYLALGLWHTDPVGGIRRVSAFWQDDDDDRWDEWNALGLLDRLGYEEDECTPASVWDDTQGWFGPRQDLISATRQPTAHVFPLAGCPHRHWEWVHDADDPTDMRMGGALAEARCARCQGLLLRAHTWQLTPRAEVRESLALGRARWWAVIHDEDPADVPTDLASLRARDPHVATQPRPRRLAGASAPTLRDTLKGQR